MSNYDSRRIVGITAERVTDVSSTDFPGHYHEQHHSWSLEAFSEGLRVSVQRLSNRSIEFDLIGVDASIANALRRILIAEVPTMCIEHVYINNNTTVLHDEVLAHRLGLVPLNVDPSLMQIKSSPDDLATERDTLVFKLSLVCKRRPVPSRLSQARESITDPSALYENHELLSSHLQWVPQGEQSRVFARCPPAPTNPNIVLAKLRPGQKVNIECHAIKGVGKDHAKFSPVATASYRLLPTITLDANKPVPPHLSHKFASCFPEGIISVHPITKAVSVNEGELRRDTVTREVLRHQEFESCVKLGRVRNHFLFKIESEGPYQPQDLLPEAIRVMREKIRTIRAAAEALIQGDLDVDMTEA